jgi:signal transduction histidine kinase
MIHISQWVWAPLFIITIMIWFLYFELNLPFDTGDVFFEGIYFTSALVSLYFIQKLDISRLNYGWGIFTFGLLIDLMDEFTHEPDIVDTYFEGTLTTLGLIVITLGFYSAVKKYTQLNKELEHTIELKDMFADIMRHDLLNPASIIKGYVRLLKQKENNNNKVELLQKIENSDQRIIEMVENASKFAKLDSTRDMEFEHRDISYIIKDVVDDYKQKLDDRNIDVEYKFDTNSKYFAYLSPVIYDVFSNLLSNAVKYSNNSGKIIINIVDKFPFWEITVTDYGIGISDQNKQLIFERFHRTEKVNIPGNGLGLAIAKKIVDLHGGDSGVRDNPDGQGSQFWVKLKQSFF